MKMNTLVRRDPALAALMGVMPAGSDFGHEESHYGSEGSDFGEDFGDDFGDEMGDEMGDDMGDDYGDDFGAAARRPRPAPAAMARAHAKLSKMNVRRHKRMLLLDPNAGSTLKIERYSFSVNIMDPATGLAPVLGTASSLSGTNTPDTSFKPERGILNVPTVGLVLVNEIKVGNVSGTVGGIGDGAEYSPLAVGTGLSLPMMTPSTKATFLGSFTTFVPPGFVPAASFPLVMTFKGWATMAPSHRC